MAAAASVHRPVYPAFPTGKRASTVLTNHGRDMTLIDDRPYLARQQRRPVTHHRGARPLHTDTFVYETNPSLAGDNSTSYGSEFSGLRFKHYPTRVRPCPRQLSQHFSFGVGDRMYKETTTGSAHRSFGETQGETALPSIVNKSFQRSGNDMKQIVHAASFNRNLSTTYRNEVASLVPSPSDPVTPKFEEKHPKQNILNWHYDPHFQNNRTDFRRVSGNRVLWNKLERSHTIL